ncbi:MAG: ABC transporter permease subunit [Desulfitobacteriaceae bacterium]
MNIYLHELKAYRKSTIIWTCTLTAMVILFLLIFPAFTKDVADFKKILGGLPEGLRKAIGLSLENVFSILGFYSYVFAYITLCGSIQAMNLGTSILSKEIRDKTADFLLTKPVSRTDIMTAKLLAALTSLVITNVIYLIVSSIIASAVTSEAYNVKTFLMISLTLFFIQLMFLSLGVLISVFIPKIKSVISISLSVVFGFFIINMLDSVIGDQAIRYITPFKYFDNTYIIKNASYETSFVILEIVWIIVALGMSYFIYSQKDIHAV